jgi:enoyl-CoA hydratase/carnithine racemase
MAAAEATDFTIARDGDVFLFTLASRDGMNRLTSRLVQSLAEEIRHFGTTPDDLPALPLILSGFTNFSAGADLNEIAALTAPAAFEFARAGQRLMRSVATFPAVTFAAIEGYCMGGGLDLALACHRRVCAPNAIFGHRGAALGLMTGWGGTQRLPRLIGKGRAMQMFLAAEKLNAHQALAAGLVEAVVDDPVTYITGSLLRSL